MHYELDPKLNRQPFRENPFEPGEGGGPHPLYQRQKCFRLQHLFFCKESFKFSHIPQPLALNPCQLLLVYDLFFVCMDEIISWWNAWQ
jgi:hypothetical protein